MLLLFLPYGHSNGVVIHGSLAKTLYESNPINWYGISNSSHFQNSLKQTFFYAGSAHSWVNDHVPFFPPAAYLAHAPELGRQNNHFLKFSTLTQSCVAVALILCGSSYYAFYVNPESTVEYLDYFARSISDEYSRAIPYPGHFRAAMEIDLGANFHNGLNVRFHDFFRNDGIFDQGVFDQGVVNLGCFSRFSLFFSARNFYHLAVQRGLNPVAVGDYISNHYALIEAQYLNIGAADNHQDFIEIVAENAGNDDELSNTRVLLEHIDNLFQQLGMNGDGG